MGTELYLFAVYIAGLICVVAIIFKLLFGNVRKHRKLLDEKESKLLQLYQTVESIMDDFSDQIATAMEDIKEHEDRMAAHRVHLAQQPEEPVIVEEEKTPTHTEIPTQTENPKRTMTVDSSRIRAASEVLERAERMVKSNTGKNIDYIVGNDGGENIYRLFDDMTDDQHAAGTETQTKSNRRESILALAEEGKTHAQIARELGITQNEVKLVIGLGASR